MPKYLRLKRNLEMDAPSIIHTSDGRGLLMTTSVFLLSFGKDFWLFLILNKESFVPETISSVPQTFSGKILFQKQKYVRNKNWKEIKFSNFYVEIDADHLSFNIHFKICRKKIQI